MAMVPSVGPESQWVATVLGVSDEPVRGCGSEH